MLLGVLASFRKVYTAELSVCTCNDLLAGYRGLGDYATDMTRWSKWGICLFLGNTRPDSERRCWICMTIGHCDVLTRQVCNMC